jgi:hypothetical protein
MGRKPIGEKAMTAAERKARLKAKAAELNAKGHPAVKPSAIGVMEESMCGTVWDRLDGGLPSRRDWVSSPKRYDGCGND